MRPSKAMMEELIRLAKRHGGALTPEQVVEAASDPQSPLHSYFEWDDTEAARKYRLVQARELLRFTVQIVAEDKPPVRAFVSLEIERDQHVYRLTSDVLRHKSYREALLEQCRKDAERFVKKYRALEELANVIPVLEQFLEETAPAIAEAAC